MAEVYRDQSPIGDSSPTGERSDPLQNLSCGLDPGGREIKLLGTEELGVAREQKDANRWRL